jgi:hypothetical protein
VKDLSLVFNLNHILMKCAAEAEIKDLFLILYPKLDIIEFTC